MPIFRKISFINFCERLLVKQPFLQAFRESENYERRKWQIDKLDFFGILYFAKKELRRVLFGSLTIRVD